MKEKLFILFLLSFPSICFCQELLTQVSNDSILIGNTIEIKYKIDNATGEFKAPYFENLTIVGGPNVSSSMQIINGQSNATKSWSYYVKPTELGEIVIPPAYIINDDQSIESLPIYLNVYPNPHGIIQDSESIGLGINGHDFFNFSFESPFKRDTIKKKKESKYKSKLKRI